MTTIKNTKKPKIIIVGGPTASGKSALAVKIAQRFDGEIIGADSMQIYRRMDIGTGKAMPNERGGIRHRLIDIIEPNQTYSAGQYCKDAGAAIDDVLQGGKLPIIAGGTGMYINALINGYSFSQTTRNTEFRLELQKQAEEFGVKSLHDKLNKIDPIAAQKIMPTDLKRIIRTLEICEFSSSIKSENIDNANIKTYDYLMLLIKMDREKLYQSINKRVDQMLTDGLINEVKSLDLSDEYTSAKAIGYKETLEYLNNTDRRFSDVDKHNYLNCNAKNSIDTIQGLADNKRISTIGELSEAIKINTRHYAKRQITYFKNVFKDLHWVEVDDFGKIESLVAGFIQTQIVDSI